MKIEALRRAFGDAPFSIAEAAETLGIQSAYSTLHRLKEAGILESAGRGRYRFAPPQQAERVAGNLERVAVQGLRAQRDAELPALARLRWEAWIRSGFIERLGPRSLRVNLRRPQPRVHVRRG